MPHKRKPVILLVDDEEHFLEIMRLELAASGFKPVPLRVEAPQEVTAHCERLMPDLVLLDIYFSGDPLGLEAATAIQKNPITQDIKILFWSTANRAFLPPAFLERWTAEMFLDKTQDPAVITQRIREVLTRSA